MSLYPEGHPPFALRGVVAEEEMTADGIRFILTRDLQSCLNGAYSDLMMSRHFLEQLRARLFRAEQLIDTNLPEKKDLFILLLLPHDMPALLETIKATARAVEEWFESTTRKTILEKYPRRPLRR